MYFIQTVKATTATTTTATTTTATATTTAGTGTATATTEAAETPLPPWMDKRFDSRVYDMMKEQKAKVYYELNTDMKVTDRKTFDQDRQASLIAYTRSCDQIDRFASTFFDMLSLLHEAGADDRLTVISLDSSSFKILRHVSYDMAKHGIPTRCMLGSLEPWHISKNALKTVLASPCGQMIRETQLWIKYWTNSNQEIAESRISLRHSTYKVTYSMARYMVDAWHEIKQNIFLTYGDSILENRDMQMLVYTLNVVLPTCLSFMTDITSSPDLFEQALYDMLHVLCIGNRDYFALTLWWLADMSGWKKREPKYCKEVLERNPHIIASAIGIELWHGFHWLLEKRTEGTATEETLNNRLGKFDLFKQVRDFQRQRNNETIKKGGSYSHPNINTGQNGRFERHKVVAKRALLDSFAAMGAGKVIDIEQCNWNSPVVYKDQIKLPPTKIKIGTAKPPYGMEFQKIENTNKLVIKSINPEAANGGNRKTELKETEAVVGDVVLGLVSGSKHKLDFSAEGITPEVFVNEMNRLQKLGKQVNVYVQPGSTTQNVVRGDKTISTSRGMYYKRANPMSGGSLDEDLLQKMSQSQKHFHRMEDAGNKKAWDHKKMPEVRQLYEKVERMLDRDVANTAASDRPVFTTDEKHYHSDEKREPKKMTELCAELHRRNKLTSEAKKNSE